MIERCTYVGVAWNEEARAPALLELMRRWFPSLVVGVQESSDRTAEIAEAFADRPSDRVILHPHYGFGDKSMPDLIRSAKTDWVFVVSFDEMPTEELLESLSTAIGYGDDNGIDGWWIPFRSSIEGIEYNEQHAHLRLFRSELGWPAKLHSRPQPRREATWDNGHIRHDRSLDEMMQDYLRYWRIGIDNPQWVTHNVLMMHDACEGVAKEKGWDFVKGFPWWPEVQSIAFPEGGRRG